MAYMLLNEDNGEELTVFDVVRLKRQIYATWKCTDPQVDLVECLEQTKVNVTKKKTAIASYQASEMSRCLANSGRSSPVPVDPRRTLKKAFSLKL